MATSQPIDGANSAVQGEECGLRVRWCDRLIRHCHQIRSTMLVGPLNFACPRTTYNKAIVTGQHCISWTHTALIPGVIHCSRQEGDSFCCGDAQSICIWSLVMFFSLILIFLSFLTYSIPSMASVDASSSSASSGGAMLFFYIRHAYKEMPLRDQTIRFPT